MTIYEQIQRALDYIEDNLCAGIRKEGVAREAGMSARGLQNYFQAVTGHSYKEYVMRRRLATAARYLASSDRKILEIALDIGYQNHESFTRAFKSEFDVSPLEFRQRRLSLNGLERLKLYKEIFMGIVVKELPEMLTVTFKGFAPESERKAKEALERWMGKDAKGSGRRRIFGHNIDAGGKVENNPDNTGYKFYAVIRDLAEARGSEVEAVPAGKFLVTGIEGNFDDDPAGDFIRRGWERMSAMVKEKGYSLKTNGRWFEEELEPQKPGNLRLDLYAEIS